jgi:ribosome-associated heat shock protein Hsp15
MRIDKFLWSIRFYKTRNIAAEEIKKTEYLLEKMP